MDDLHAQDQLYPRRRRFELSWRRRMDCLDDHTICGPSIEYPLHHGSTAVGGGGHYALP
jgi:hypothetical protein